MTLHGNGALVAVVLAKSLKDIPAHALRFSGQGFGESIALVVSGNQRVDSACYGPLRADVSRHRAELRQRVVISLHEFRRTGMAGQFKSLFESTAAHDVMQLAVSVIETIDVAKF